MKKRLIIDGNAVYEIDEDCMVKKRLDEKQEKKKKDPYMEAYKKAMRRTEW